MCVLAFAWKAHPRWRMVLAGNRDERHDRPASALNRWSAGGVVAGVDLLSGGTWLGVSDQGRLAVVTNLGGHGPPDPALASRGALVKDWLTGQGRYAAPGIADLDDFNAFNLITVADSEAVFWSNRPARRQPLDPGVYGLSNGGLDEPWPKTLRLRSGLQTWLNGDASDTAGLFAALADDRVDTGGDALHRKLSAVFIRDPIYGTRCSTAVAVDHDGHGLIAERRFDAEGHFSGETVLPFEWQDFSR